MSWSPTTPHKKTFTRISILIWRATLGHNVYTHTIQAPFLSKIGWLFHSHKPTDLHYLMKFLETLVWRLNPAGPLIAFGLQFKNIWDGYKTPKAIPLPSTGAPCATPLAQPKCQAVCAMLKWPKSMRVPLSPSFTEPCAPKPSMPQPT